MSGSNRDGKTRHGRKVLGTLALGVMLGGALAVLPVAGPATAEAGGCKAVKQGLKDERLKTTQMFGVAWHDDWRAVVIRNRFEAARNGPHRVRNGKGVRPILFLRILGDLAEGT